jgi:hypothetical protein
MLRFSPDGKALATLSRTGPDQLGEIRLWQAADAGTVPTQGSRIENSGATPTRLLHVL